MNPQESFITHGEPSALHRSLDQARNDFEQAWRAGRRPKIQKIVMAAAPEIQDALLVELIALEVELRRKAGELVTQEKYTERFPESPKQVAEAFQRLERNELPETLTAPALPGSSDTSRMEASPAAETVTFVPLREAAGEPSTVALPEQAAFAFPPEQDVSAASPPSGGRFFGDYEMLEEIARGGMGVVYKARQRKLNRVVALKMILSGQFAGPQDVQRFHSEAEAAAQLDHPGIVPIYEIGEHQGQYFFSMAYVPGSSLAAKVKDGPLPEREAAELVQKIAQAVQYAHERGIIHRDLKPHNVLLDQQGEPKVTDFGLAKRVEGDSGLTATGAVMGTPSYMPPEQAAGKREVGPAADVYALGAILYHLITGRPPFQAANPMDTILQVLQREPVSPRELNSTVDRDLETICLKCMQKEPRNRYPSARVLADELARYLSGRPIEARPVRRLERAWRWSKRNPALASAGGVVLVLLVTLAVGAMVFAWEQHRFANQETRLRNDAVQAAAKASASQQLATRRAVDATAAQRESERSLQKAMNASYGRQITAAASYVESDPKQSLNLLNDPFYCPPERRDFAWSLLNRVARRDQVQWQAHQGRVQFVNFSPDGRLLFSGGVDGEVTSWNVATQERHGRFQGNSLPILGGEVSPNGAWLAVYNRVGTVHCWDTAQSTMPWFSVALKDKVNAITFSPDSTKLAACTSNRLFVWNLTTGKLLAKSEFEDNISLWSIAFSSNSAGLVVGTASPLDSSKGWTSRLTGSVKFLRASDLTASAFSIDIPDLGAVVAIACSPGNEKCYLLTYSNDWVRPGRTAELKEIDFRTKQIRIQGFYGTPLAITRNPRTRALVTASLPYLRTLGRHPQSSLSESPPPGGIFHVASEEPNSHSVQFWDPETLERDTYLSSDPRASCVAFSPAGDLLATGDDSGVVTLWEANSNLARLQMRTAVKPSHIEFSSDGSRLLIAGGRRNESLDTRSWTLSWTELDDLFTGPAAYLPEHGLFAAAFTSSTAGAAPRLQVRRMFSNKIVADLADCQLTCKPVFSPAGQLLVAGVSLGDQAALKAWSLPSGASVYSAPLAGPIRLLAMSKDGKRLAIWKELKKDHFQLAVHDTATGNQVAETEGMATEPRCLEFVSSDEYLITVATDNSNSQIRQWRSSDLNLLADNDEENCSLGKILALDRHQIVALAGSGFRGQQSGEILLWDVAARRVSKKLPGHQRLVWCLTCSPDGRILVSGSADHSAKLWSLPDGIELLTLRGHQSTVLDAKFSAKGNMLITAGYDDSVRVWQGLFEEKSPVPLALSAGTPHAPKQLIHLPQQETLVAMMVEYMNGKLSFQQVEGGQRITKINAARTPIGDPHMRNLADCSELRELILNFTPITDAGMRFIGKCRNLQTLELWYTNISDEGLAEIADLTKLQTLNLGFTQVTDQGLQYLSEMRSLQSLTLRAAQITDAGLSQIRHLTALKYLELWETQITDEGLRHLQGMTNLETLFIQETRVTPSGVEALKKALPNCEIAYSPPSKTDR